MNITSKLAKISARVSKFAPGKLSSIEISCKTRQLSSNSAYYEDRWYYQPTTLGRREYFPSITSEQRVFVYNLSAHHAKEKY